MQPSLQGSLKSFRLFDLLTFLSLCKKTGTLELTRPGASATAFFRNSDLIYASSDQETLRIGSIMRDRNIIDAVQSARIASDRSADERFGASAVRLGMLSDDQLRAALKVQVSEIIYDALTWHDGEFRFFDEMELPAWAVTISVDLTNLVMEGARRIDEWEQCLQLLPDDQVVFRIADDQERQERISLSLDEWKVLFRFDGHQTLKQVLEGSGLDPLELYKVVYGLLASELLEEKPSDASTRRTLRQQLNAPIPSPAGHTGKIPAALVEISDDAWKEIEDDTRLLVSGDATLSLRDVKRMTTSTPRLRAIPPEGDAQFFVLEAPSYLIGRAADAAIRFTDTGVSARHAQITRDGDGYVLEDLNSRNGTFVNDTAVERWRLRDGDEIRMGRVVMQYQVLYSVE
jgi:hypothetical protein